MPIRMVLLFVLYSLIAVVALWRTFTFNGYDLLSIGVFPVMVGLWTKAQWAYVVWFFFLGLQTLGFIALSMVALIAYQITPEDVQLNFQGVDIAMIPLAICLMVLIIFQWWVALSAKTKQHLQKSNPSTTANTKQ